MIARSTKKNKSRTSMPEDDVDVDYSRPRKKKGGKKHTGMDKKKH